MFTDADVQAVTEFTRIARVFHPSLVWESLTTEAGKPFMLITTDSGNCSWFVEREQKDTGVWEVLAAHYGEPEEVLGSGTTPAGALQGVLKSPKVHQMEETV